MADEVGADKISGTGDENGHSEKAKHASITISICSSFMCGDIGKLSTLECISSEIGKLPLPYPRSSYAF